MPSPISQSSASQKCQAHRQIPCPDGYPAVIHLLKDSDTTTAIMAALNKIAPTSPSRQHPSELETSIANALYDLESNIPDMKSALRPLQFVSAREVRGYYCNSRHTPFQIHASRHTASLTTNGALPSPSLTPTFHLHNQTPQ